MLHDKQNAHSHLIPYTRTRRSLCLHLRQCKKVGGAGGYLYLIWLLEIFIKSLCGMNGNGDRHLSAVCFERLYWRRMLTRTRSQSREVVNVCPYPLCARKKKRGGSKSKKRLSRKREETKAPGFIRVGLSPNAMHRKHAQEFFAIQRDRKYGKGFVVRNEKRRKEKRKRGRKLDPSLSMWSPRL